MKIIDGVAHLVIPLNLASKLCDDVREHVQEMQGKGLEVEVQYQQSNNAVSVLILGRREERD